MAVPMPRPIRSMIRNNARTPWAPPSSSRAASLTGRDEHGGYIPSPTDIADLRFAFVKAKKVPADIVDDIFNFAEYWVCSSNELDFMKEHGDSMKVQGSSRVEDKFLLRSYPIGLTGFADKKNLAEELAYDTNLPEPHPLEKEHDASFFANLANYPTPTLTSPVRKIVFNIRCRDQGTGGNTADRGTFNASWTWVDAGLERFDAAKACDPQCVADLRYESRLSKAPQLPLCSLRPVEPKIEPTPPDPRNADQDHSSSLHHELHPLDLLTIQRNRVAIREFEDYTVTWRWDDDITDPESEAAKALHEAGRGKLSGSGEFVRGLKLGDVVTVWAKARFPGWVNQIERVSIDIYWTV